MNTYKHSVSLDTEKCTGCTTCIHRCPTEAIRVRAGHAVINPDRCIDCGECIKVCTQKAKKAVLDGFDEMKKFRYKIALPAPSLYAQFDNLDDVDYVLQGLIDIGFDAVFDNQVANLLRFALRCCNDAYFYILLFAVSRK